MKLAACAVAMVLLAGCSHMPGRVRDLKNPLIEESCPSISDDSVPADMGSLSLAYIARNQQYNLCRLAALKKSK